MKYSVDFTALPAYCTQIIPDCHEAQRGKPCPRNPDQNVASVPFHHPQPSPNPIHVIGLYRSEIDLAQIGGLHASVVAATDPEPIGSDCRKAAVTSMRPCPTLPAAAIQNATIAGTSITATFTSAPSRGVQATRTTRTSGNGIAGSIPARTLARIATAPRRPSMPPARGCERVSLIGRKSMAAYWAPKLERRIVSAFTLDDVILTDCGCWSITEATTATRSEFTFTSIPRAEYSTQAAGH